VTARLAPPLPWVCLVTDHTVCDGVMGLERAVMSALDSGVNIVQLREKSLAAGELFELGRRLRRLTTEAGAALIVNDRADVALAVQADGVHLGESGLPVETARGLIGARLLGRSVHELTQAIEAEKSGVDYLVVGTIFRSASHPEAPAAGPRLIRKVNAQVNAPVMAIGGITADNAAQAIAAGASGVAVIRAILADSHPGQAARRLVDSVQAAWPTAVLHRGA
jgi:thiamine-phosphate pyrophosphorylase